MLVKCPSCRTTYKVSDELLKGTTPGFRCSRCKHTFELEETETAVSQQKIGPPLGSARPKSAEDELSFKFSARDQTQIMPTEEDKAPSGDFSQPQPNLAPDVRVFDQPWAMPQVEAKPEKPFTISETPEWDKDGDFVDPRGDSVPDDPFFESLSQPKESEHNVLALDPYRDQQASTLPYMTLFALLVISFSLITAFYHTYPEASQALVKKIPLVGAAVLKNTYLKNSLALKSIDGNYQNIQGNREVFVVTGVAMNQNPVVLRQVRIGGRIYGQDGKTIEEQSIWLGNALSARIIRGMTSQDILDLQRLKPLKSFEMPPGDSVPFTIVFLKPPQTIKDFSCEILAAEAEA